MLVQPGWIPGDARLLFQLFLCPYWGQLCPDPMALGGEGNVLGGHSWIPSRQSGALGALGSQQGPLTWPEGQDRATTPEC